jgi:hypothetical protein
LQQNLHFSDMTQCPYYVRFVQQSGRYEIADVGDVPIDLSAL